MEAKPNRNRTLETLAWAASLLLLVPGTLAAERTTAREVRPGYARSQAERPATARPARRAPMPEPLRRTKVGDTGVVPKAGNSASRGAAATRPRAGDAGPRIERGPDRLAEQARSAAVWAAERSLATRGKAEYYRAGFFLGQRDALADPTLGEWDFRDGRRFAHRDPEARRAGLAEGEAHASELAFDEANRRVRAQFMNLEREPRFDPFSTIPAYVADLRSPAGPTVHEVLADFPLSDFAFANGRPDFVAGLRIDAVRLRGSKHYTDFYDRDWDDPGSAFRTWSANPGRSRFFRALSDPADRRRFRAVFDVAFSRQLNRLGQRPLERAFDRGVDDGFDYGAFVRRELDYRLGYFQGFNDALRNAAAMGFQRAFPASFETAYTSLFREWTDNPKPAIGEVRLIDTGGDGVFEPGERVIVETELINYGGRAGRFPIHVEGSVLQSGGATERGLLLPARSVELDRRLVAKIRNDTPNRTRTLLAVRLDDQSATLPLTVSFPLQFVPGSLSASRRNLQGEVRVEIDVENQSRVWRDGTFEVTAAGIRGVPALAKIADLGPGRTATLSLRIDGLPVLDLIAGDVTLNLRAESEGREQDSVVYRVPDVVRDLGNDDLLEYVVSLSRDPATSRREAARARSLFLLRLRADWSDAVRRSGNPYKSDFRHGGTSTALGELVRTADSVRRESGGREMFGGLSRDVVTLAGELPGPHPFLRKYMRRLARELP